MRFTRCLILPPIVHDKASELAYRKVREFLRAGRLEADLTQIELSRRLKRPQSFVSKYERGERQLDVVEFGEVAQALGIDGVTFLRKLYEEIL